MREKEYRASNGISRSELWQLRESPEKFKWTQEHPEEPTPSLIFGSLVHKLLLEPETFDDDFAIIPDVDRRTKAGKEAYNAFLSGFSERYIISHSDYEKALQMANKAKQTPFVSKLLDNGKHEVAYYWEDDLTKELCKVRLDCVSEVGGKKIIVDYKTTANASTESFMRSAINYGYDFQAAMYCEGYEKSTGKKPLFVFIAQEKEPPYAVNILQADEYFLKRGYDVFRELIGVYHDCKESGNWYGYLGAYDVINNLSLPSYLAKDL